MKLLRHQIRALEIAFPDGFIEEGKKIGEKTWRALGEGDASLIFNIRFKRFVPIHGLAFEETLF